MFAEIDTGDHRSPEEIRVAVASSRKERRNKENAGGWATEANEDREFKSRKRSARCRMEGRPMNAGRFVIDGLAIPANGNAQRYREYPIGPAPGAVGLARSLFSYSNPGGGGRLARGVRGSAARLRVVRAHSQNYRPWRHIERTPCTPCWSSCCARPVACVVRPPPPPPVSQISISRGIGNDAVHTKYV